MSDNGKHSISSTTVDRHARSSSSSSSQGSNKREAYSQKENDETIMNQPPPASSLEEQQIKLKSLIKRIDSMGKVRDRLKMFLLLLGGISVLSLCIPVFTLGMSFYSIELVCHSLSFSCLFILHCQVIPSLINECNIISNNIEEETHYPPTSYPTKSALFWCYLRISFSILYNTGIWIYLSSMGSDESEEQLVIGFLLGMLLVLISFYALFHVDFFDPQPERKKHKTEQGREDTGNGVNIQMHDLPRTEDRFKTHEMEEITKLRDEMLKKDKILKYLQERDKEKDK